MKQITLGGVNYRVDEIVALLEEKVSSGTETDYEMDLYIAYLKNGPEVLAENRDIVISLILSWREEDE